MIKRYTRAWSIHIGQVLHLPFWLGQGCWILSVVHSVKEKHVYVKQIPFQQRSWGQQYFGKLVCVLLCGLLLSPHLSGPSPCHWGVVHSNEIDGRNRKRVLSFFRTRSIIMLWPPFSAGYSPTVGSLARDKRVYLDRQGGGSM